MENYLEAHTVLRTACTDKIILGSMFTHIMNFVGLQQTISQGEHCDQDPSKHSDTITK